MVRSRDDLRLGCAPRNTSGVAPPFEARTLRDGMHARTSRVTVPTAALAMVLVVLTGALGPGPSAAQTPSAATVTDGAAGASRPPDEDASRAASPSPDASPSAQESTETAQELIAKALEDGLIDYPTSLAYRGYAFWGDDRLPEELWGIGSANEDQALTREVEALGDDIPDGLRAVLGSLVVRPSDARSIANRQLDEGDAIAAAPGSDGSLAVRPPSRMRFARCPGDLGWRGERADASIRLKFWAVCDGNEEAALNTAIVFARTIWIPMTQYMGEPIPDDGTGGDDAIDIYLMTPGIAARHRGGVISPDALAATSRADPRLGRRSSAYVLMPRAGVGSDTWKQALIHELFHVLQNRHNTEVMFQPAPGGWSEWWFTEASATWAEAKFGPTRRREMPHGWRFAPFQRTASDTSLNVSHPDDHMYDAYVWPLFMQQEKGADVIRRAWDLVESVGPGDFDHADRVLDGIVSFETRFREFAVRMLDKQLPGDPIAPRLQVVDAETPIDVPPPVEARSRLAPVPIKEMGHVIPERLEWLTATYIKLDPHPDSRQVTLDFRKLRPARDLDVDLLVLLDGAQQVWTRRRVGPNERVRYCFDKPDQDVAEMYVILSNHQKRAGATIFGSFRVRPVAEPCGQYRIAGTWTVKSGQGGVLTDTDFEATYDFSWDPGYDPGEPGSGRFHSSIATGTPPLPCKPGQFWTVDGPLVPSARASGQRVLFILSPDFSRWRQPSLSTPFLPDVFSTLLTFPQYGSRFLDIGITGGTYRWRDGAIPMDVVCKGRRPTGMGTATIVRIRDT